MATPIYLDYNGTTPHAPEVIDAMWARKTSRTLWGWGPPVNLQGEIRNNTGRICSASRTICITASSPELTGSG